MTEYIKRKDVHLAFDSYYFPGKLSLRETIDSVPFADVQPVVRGKWKHGVCQTCFFDWSEVAPFANVPNFCPNCGADMRDKVV